MAPYSIDLRQKILSAWENKEGTQRELAERFKVSLSFIRDFLRRYRVELCWSKLKRILCSEAACTFDALNEAITVAINAITDENALNWFNHCGLFFEPI